jgi:broad-specificity NMP kinase
MGAHYMRILLISGQVGSGKTTVAKRLLTTLDNAALIELDSLVAVNPFEFNDSLHNLGIENAVSLIRNFSKNGYEHIIVSGLIKNQKSLDSFFDSLLGAQFFLVWLRADQAMRKQRKQSRARDDADKEENFDFIDRLTSDTPDFSIKNGKYSIIDTTTKSVEDVVQEVQALIAQ